MASATANQVDRNYEAFLEVLPKLMPEHSGSFALLHECKVIDFFRSSLEATLEGANRFGAERFSVQEVTDQPDHLGFYSYVGGAGAYPE